MHTYTTKKSIFYKKRRQIATRCGVQSDIVGLHTKWHYGQHSVDEINIALDRIQKKKTTFRLSSLVRCVGDSNP